MRIVLLVACLALAGCRHIAPPPQQVQPKFPALPDTIYTASGATPIVFVDSIPSDNPRLEVIGQYRYLERRLLLSRKIKDERQQRKTVEHEICHIVLAEAGLDVPLNPSFAELLCNAFANARVSDLERQRPR